MSDKFDEIIELSVFLTEEIKYHAKIESHIKELEATLWGLEEQAAMPENKPKDMQDSLNEQMNSCRRSLKASQKLISSHTSKVKQKISLVF